MPEPASAPPLADQDGDAGAALPSRERVLVWSCMAAITALAWAYLIYLDRTMGAMAPHDPMMAGMGMPMPRAWTGADGLYTFAMWLVMMIGMMASAATPVILLYAQLQRRRQGGRLPATVVGFGLGYLAVWAGFSAGMTLVQWALHEAMMLSPRLALSSGPLAGAVLCLAGLYQLTPLKQRCLRHCRSPLGFLMTHWRDGNRGAWTMGIRHGAFCLGCCWALMAVLFVTGVMSLGWVAALALLVLLEKVGPAGLHLARVSGVLLIAAGALMMWSGGAATGG